MTFHLITSALMSVCALYLCLRCVLPLRVRGWIKALACALVFLCAYKLQVSQLLFPGVVIPEVGTAWLVVSGWAFAVIIVWTLLSLLWDICLLGYGLFRRAAACVAHRSLVHGTPRRHGWRVAGLLVSSLLLATGSTYQGIRVPPVKQVNIYIDNLPAAMRGFRIVQLSDMHISPLFRAQWAKDVVAQTNALQPDLIVLTGDMIDGSPRARAADVAPLADLRARYGVYACLGNHEYYAGVQGWLETFQELGIRTLVNTHAVLSVAAPEEGDAAHKDSAATGVATPAILVLGGIADPTGATRMGHEAPDMGKTFAGSPESPRSAENLQDPPNAANSGTAPTGSRAGFAPEAVRVLLSHQPRLARDAAKYGIALQLSGHTHGGQLFPASLTVGAFNEGYLAGEYVVDAMRLYISRGVGLWGGFPVRLGAPSEITEITLLPSGATQAKPAR